MHAIHLFVVISPNVKEGGKVPDIRRNYLELRFSSGSVFDPTTTTDDPRNIKVYQLLDASSKRGQIRSIQQSDNVGIDELPSPNDEEGLRLLEFFYHQERRFRYKVQRHCSENVSQVYDQVEFQVEQILRTVIEEFGDGMSLDDLLKNVRSTEVSFSFW